MTRDLKLIGVTMKKKKNICVTLLSKTKRKYFSNLNIRNVSNNKTFWRTVQPFSLARL